MSGEHLLVLIIGYYNAESHLENQRSTRHETRNPPKADRVFFFLESIARVCTRVTRIGPLAENYHRIERED